MCAVRKLIERCPACSGALVVTRLQCTCCDTEITGRFQTTLFDRLSPESLSFAELFMRLRGNVKEMERELGVPYSAVRSRLDEIIRELGFETQTHSGEGEDRAGDPRPEAVQRREILEQLECGEIDPARAIAELEALKIKGGKP